MPHASHARRTAPIVYALDMPSVAAFYAGVLGLQAVHTDAAYFVQQASEIDRGS